MLLFLQYLIKYSNVTYYDVYIMSIKISIISINLLKL